MSLLQQLGDALRERGGNGASEPGAAVEVLEQVAGTLDAASSVWGEFRDEAPALDNPFTFLLAFGAERARRLHALHLQGRELGGRLTELSGLPFRDALGLSDELDVVQAYAQVSPGDTAESVAAAAVDTLSARRQRIVDTIASLRS